MTGLQVVVAEDLALLRQGLRSLLVTAGFDVVGQSGDADDLLTLVGLRSPDVAIVDIRMPPTYTDEGIRATHEIRRRFPTTAVLVLSQYLETEFAHELISQGGGSIGYLLKQRVTNVAELGAAVRRVADGQAVIDPEIVSRLVQRPRPDDRLAALTDRERSVLALMAEGRTNQAIADQLCLSPKTVESHVRNVFGKLDLDPTPSDHRRVLAVLTFLRM